MRLPVPSVEHHANGLFGWMDHRGISIKHQQELMTTLSSSKTGEQLEIFVPQATAQEKIEQECLRLREKLRLIKDRCNEIVHILEG